MKCFIFFLWTAPCPTGWVIGPNDSKCFIYMGSPRSWKESENECKRNGGHLAALTSFQELNFAHNLCKEVVNGCWVGGRVVNSTTGFSWKWSDNSSYWNESILSGPNFQFNCSSSPCPTKNSFDLCTLVTNNGSTPFTSERCNKSHAFICMLDIGMYLYIMAICYSPQSHILLCISS